MNMNDIAHALTLLEGKKKSVSIGQVKEVLGYVSDLLYLNGGFSGEIYACLWKCGKRRATVRSKKRKGRRKND